MAEELPSGTVSNMPWRKAGVKHSNNEIYIDIVEEIDAVVDVSGSIISWDVSGYMQAQSHLSGVPDLILTFKDPSVIDDCSLHPCVRYARYENDSVVSFVPPDGDFELMRYRVSPDSARSFIPPLYCQPLIGYSDGKDGKSLDGRITLNVFARSMSSLIFSASRKGPLVVEDVTVVIPFPRIVRTANLTVTVGSVIYDEAGKIAKWTIGKLDEQKRPQLTGTMQLEGTKRPGQSSPLVLSWKIPLASVSGLSVSGLSLTGEHYNAYKGVRNICKSGRYQVRCF